MQKHSVWQPPRSFAQVPELKLGLASMTDRVLRRPLWKETSRTELAPWLALAAVLPLGFVLWRRNLP